MRYKRYLIALILNLLIIAFPALYFLGEDFLIIAYLIIWIVISIPSAIITAIFRTSKNDIAVLGFACGLPILFCGLLFRLMHWPGGIVYTYAGLILLVISVIAILLYKSKNKHCWQP